MFAAIWILLFFDLKSKVTLKIMVWPHKSGIGIKLVRMGCSNRPYYQIGAMPSRRRTGLLPDEVIGSFDPVPNERNEVVVAVDLSRLSYWMGRRGRLSVGMETILGKFQGSFTIKHNSPYYH